MDAAAGPLFGRNRFSAEETHHVGEALNQGLDYNHMSWRPGANKQKVVYMAASQAIDNANRVFGFNGWSSSIVQLTEGDCDQDGKGIWTAGASAIIRVTLRDGCFREDIGESHIRDRNKGDAREKARKAAVTDGLKRALRLFGPQLGSQLTDKKSVSEAEKQHRQRQRQPGNAALGRPSSAPGPTPGPTSGRSPAHGPGGRGPGGAGYGSRRPGPSAADFGGATVPPGAPVWRPAASAGVGVAGASAAVGPGGARAGTPSRGPGTPPPPPGPGPPGAGGGRWAAGDTGAAGAAAAVGSSAAAVAAAAAAAGAAHAGHRQAGRTAAHNVPAQPGGETAPAPGRAASAVTAVPASHRGSGMLQGGWPPGEGPGSPRPAAAAAASAAVAGGANGQGSARGSGGGSGSGCGSAPHSLPPAAAHGNVVRASVEPEEDRDGSPDEFGFSQLDDTALALMDSVMEQHSGLSGGSGGDSAPGPGLDGGVADPGRQAPRTPAQTQAAAGATGRGHHGAVGAAAVLVGLASGGPGGGQGAGVGPGPAAPPQRGLCLAPLPGNDAMIARPQHHHHHQASRSFSSPAGSRDASPATVAAAGPARGGCPSIDNGSGGGGAHGASGQGAAVATAQGVRAGCHHQGQGSGAGSSSPGGAAAGAESNTGSLSGSRGAGTCRGGVKRRWPGADDHRPP